MSAGRKYLNDRQWREMFEAQGCVCAVRGCGNATGPYEADHEIPNAIQPGLPTQIICVPCHRAKSRAQAPVIAKVRRLAGDTETQFERRKRLKSEGKYRPIPGGGFSKSRPRTAEEIMGQGR